MTFTVFGAYSGSVYGHGLTVEQTRKWTCGYDQECTSARVAPGTVDVLGALVVGGRWRSHADGRGIVVCRTS